VKPPRRFRRRKGARPVFDEPRDDTSRKIERANGRVAVGGCGGSGLAAGAVMGAKGGREAMDASGAQTWVVEVVVR
jgi:hypothetical protein